MHTRTRQPQPNLTTGSRLYLSQILGKPILDAQGSTVGRVKDLVVKFGDVPHPPVSGIVARRDRRDFYLDARRVGELKPDGFHMSVFTLDLRPFERRDGETLLRRDILDKQLIDIDGRRLVRANDLEMAWADGQYHLVGVDISPQGLLRRLGPSRFVADLPSGSLINWADVESFGTQTPLVRLRSSNAGLSRLHPVEIAQIVEALTPRQGMEVLESLDEETAADIVQELDPDDAAEILEMLDPEVAADILEEMEPNDAADVLAEMSDADSDELLHLMEPEESQDLRELLDLADQFAEDATAGLMTTEFLSVSPEVTASSALKGLRQVPDLPDRIDLICVTGPEIEPGRQPLVGAVTLRDLAVAPPGATVESLMLETLVTVEVDAPARDAAEKMLDYGLATLPVVDQDGCVLGVVHLDDALETMMPDLFGRKLTGMFS